MTAKETNNNNIKLDSNGDEIVYEVRHHLTWWDYLMFSIFFPFGCLLVYIGLSMENIADIVFILISLTFSIWLLHDLFYKRKNRFYVTNSGIGFECRHWFRMQKRFFKFGEVGIIQGIGSRKIFYAQPYPFILFPLQTQVLSKWYGYVIKSKIKYKIVVMSIGESILSPKIYDKITERIFLKDFIMQKTQESCKNQNIEIKSFTHMGRFAIFGVKNEQQQQ
ncbi:TPA: hypothetical protein SHD04_001849 [Campylobacter coli]|nr:hypothetical protein [Campylobacter coli]HEH5040841.1 hypothetical protein [Campylobacter coli]HEH5151890.1 hypothetical protein [Campylobacter coli]HEH5389641.1 hypothetical protein [Campylobacter coli]HEH5419182.1 hypothetical protein [Campylobacter coli]